MSHQDPGSVENNVEQAFCKILRESMQGIPILNSKINVEALGFQSYQGRIMGIVITPWLMNVILLPAQNDDWSGLDLGHKETRTFGSRAHKFLVNDIDGIGICQTHSLHSPMNEFSSHEHARRAAQSFLDGLLTDADPADHDVVDEDLLGRILRGEETPEVNLDDFASVEPLGSSIPIKLIPEKTHTLKRKLDRRALLRGKFLEGG